MNTDDTTIRCCDNCDTEYDLDEEGTYHPDEGVGFCQACEIGWWHANGYRHWSETRVLPKGTET